VYLVLDGELERARNVVGVGDVDDVSSNAQLSCGDHAQSVVWRQHDRRPVIPSGHLHHHTHSNIISTGATYSQLEYLAVYGRASMGSIIKNLCSPKKWTKVHQNCLGMLLHKTSNHAKLCGDRLKNGGDIRDGKFLVTKKWAKVHRIFLGDATP